MSIAIVTDSSVTFPHTTFTGQHLVKVVSHSEEGRSDSASRAAFPTPEDFLHRFHQLGSDYAHILVAVMSAGLGPVMKTATEAAARYSGHARITVLDSRNTSAGLGALVALAAASAQAGESINNIEQQLRAAIPHIYTLLSVPQLDHLSANGFISPAQAVVGNMLGIFPIFVLEEGKLSPLQKVRTGRHLIESLQEFMEEFEAPRHVALIKGAHNRTRTRPLKQFAAELFPHTPLTEHSLPAPLTKLFGDDALGLVVLDKI